MGGSKHTMSIFSRPPDRVAFVAYFLGAVVPLVALGAVIERYSLAALTDTYLAIGLIGQFAAMAVLSLSCFFMLRRMALRSRKRMDQDKLQLASLLRASKLFAVAQDGSNAAATAARAALEMTSARAAFVLLRGERGGPARMAAAAGADATEVYRSLRDPLVELENLVMSEGRPAICGGSQGAERDFDSAIAAAAVVPLPTDATPLGALAVIHTDSHKSFDSAQVDSLFTLAGLASGTLRNAELRDAQGNFFSHVTDILVSALDAHLDYHGGHARRVAQYANGIGHDLGLDGQRMERLHFAALLHDIGMLKIDRRIQHTPKVCEKHPLFGFRMLSRIRLWEDIAPLVLHHHEWFDGSGYPQGLAGESIPLESRIIAFCEAFDAMTASTSYKEALPLAEALREIETGAGKQFDPDVVRAFRNIIEPDVIYAGISATRGSEEDLGP